MKNPVSIEAFQRLLESSDQEKGLLDAIFKLGKIDDTDELNKIVKNTRIISWSGWSW